ncbi:MAG: hypothetical protein WA584_17345 [Pyrinomonadaceae bacterium]
MIELRKDKDRNKLNLYVDDIWSKGASINVDYYYDKEKGQSVLTGKNFWLRLRDEQTSKLLLPHLFSDLPHFRHLGFIVDFDWTAIINYVRFFVNNNKSQPEYEIVFRLSPDFSKWKSLYNFADYVFTFQKILENSEQKNVKISRVSRSEFAVTFFENPKFAKIGDVIDYYEKILKKWHIQTEESLLINFHSDEILASFNFPDEIKVPCKQYLEYFATFLKDLGLNATANLKEEAGKVLFSVTPTDDIEALDKIR